MSGTHNNGLHQSGRGGAVALRPIVEARPAGEAGCCAYGRTIVVAFALTLSLWPSVSAEAQKPAATTAIKRPQGKAPVKGDRAIQVWALAMSEPQSESVIKELQALLVDPDKEARVAAAWALGHLKVKETGKEAQAYDEAPRLKKQTKPFYPDNAYYGRIEGVVGVEFVIDELGRVVHAEVRDSIGPLDGSAVDCVKKWEFAPGKFAGKAVPVMALAPVSFKIDK